MTTDKVIWQLDEIEYKMDFWDLVSNSGIILEIIGFVLMLKATGHLKQEGGSFTVA